MLRTVLNVADAIVCPYRYLTIRLPNKKVILLLKFRFNLFS